MRALLSLGGVVEPFDPGRSIPGERSKRIRLGERLAGERDLLRPPSSEDGD